MYFAKKADCSPWGRKESDTTKQLSMHMYKSRHRISVPLWHLRMSCFAFLWAFPCPFSFPHLDNSCSSFGSHLRFHFLSAASPVCPSLGETSFLTLPHNLLCFHVCQSGNRHTLKSQENPQGMMKHLRANPTPEPKKAKGGSETSLRELGAAEESPTETKALEESWSLLEPGLGKAEALVNSILTSLYFLPHSRICPEVLYLSRNQGARKPRSVSWASGFT